MPIGLQVNDYDSGDDISSTEDEIVQKDFKHQEQAMEGHHHYEMVSELDCFSSPVFLHLIWKELKLILSSSVTIGGPISVEIIITLLNHFIIYHFLNM